MRNLKNVFAEERSAFVCSDSFDHKEKALGYIGIDIVDKYRIWTLEDYQWLSSIANIISIITKMARINEALDHSGKLLRNIYTNIPVGIELYDKDGYLVDMNNKDVDIFGLGSKKRP